MRPGADKLIGVDLGGTFAKTAIVRSDGAIVHKLSRPTNPARGPEVILRSIADQVRDMLGEAGVAHESVSALGIGSPGPLSHRQGLIYRAANLPGWVDVPVPKILSSLTGFDCVLHNDANAAAYGEFWAGAGREPAIRDMVFLTLGTGVGSGIILEGRLLQGHFENAGELGHMIVVENGRHCPCGQRGCLEQYASSSSVTRRVVERAKRSTEGSLARRVLAGESITTEDVVEAVRGGDGLAHEVWDETCRFLAIACVNIQHAFNPAMIVLGGGMSQAGSILFDNVKRHFDAFRWRLADDTPRIAPATLGNDAGVIGAAGLAME